jgi:hypothetical protein
MKFGAKKNPTVLAGVTLRAKFHSKIPYSVEKYIVGISQYAYFRLNLFMDQLVGFNKVSHLWLQIEVKICEQVDFKL